MEKEMLQECSDRMTYQEMMEELDDIWTFGHEPTDKQRDAVSIAMDILEEIQQYRAIGTPDRLRAAMAKQTPADPHVYSGGYACPGCGVRRSIAYKYRYCPDCGQRMS